MCIRVTTSSERTERVQKEDIFGATEDSEKERSDVKICFSISVSTKQQQRRLCIFAILFILKACLLASSDLRDLRTRGYFVLIQDFSTKDSFEKAFKLKCSTF